MRPVQSPDVLVVSAQKTNSELMEAPLQVKTMGVLPDRSNIAGS